LRDLRGRVHRDQRDALGAVIRLIFTATDRQQARRRLAHAVDQLERRLPKVARLLDGAEDDVLAFYSCPTEHWPKIRSTDESVKRRGFGSGLFWVMDRSWRVGGGPQIVAQRVGLARGERLLADSRRLRAYGSLHPFVASFATRCQLELRFCVGVVDPRAKRRFWD
jgi:hypothetical protein